MYNGVYIGVNMVMQVYKGCINDTINDGFTYLLLKGGALEVVREAAAGEGHTRLLGVNRLLKKVI